MKFDELTLVFIVVAIEIEFMVGLLVIEIDCLKEMK